MLVLRRLSGQSIAIGNNAEIIIKVLKNEDGIVSIGIDAPKTVLVDRLEKYMKRFYLTQNTDLSHSCQLSRLIKYNSN